MVGFGFPSPTVAQPFKEFFFYGKLIDYQTGKLVNLANGKA